ncbi:MULTISPECIES: enoyl-CoA hydratase/isomerase family protein [unclassified Pseudoclavibacter]|uniref:enoyl-CoA hydratase/isomerase family protein n=1 Tax=unclassified Pseudoclavibacter TaxID=2615177 RepID=UPI0013010F54|nr:MULTISPECIES: enoyl-CoA hydratase/isomerase family protein [unclassified Pseudoclavibacter]KAB1659108.1 enoyl-CoA hydratase/isomerase family protein [Pseudoclavibacter sp. CFCC 11306]KAB1660912.1 enoyl-CoA hydratase/isomerase family protein [Pseudoclavibacter sp. CFCC 13796]
MTTEQTTQTHVLTTVRGHLGEILLNRERAINALTSDMIATIHSQLDEWIDDDQVQAVLIRGAGARGLCSGADIRALSQASAFERYDFFDAEYSLDLCIARYPKPVVAFMDGITMGAGVGISAHSAFPVVTERSRVAMPEVRIGLMPDVGATWLLARAPGRLGHLLAYTAGEMTGSDAIAMGFAGHFVPSDYLGDVVDGLIAGVGTGDEALENTRRVISSSAVEPPASVLVRNQAGIDEAFADTSPSKVIASLHDHGDDGADEAADLIAGMCPFSLIVTERALQLAAESTLEQVFETDLRLCSGLTARPDFREGVRAQVIDKDRNPVWNPSRLTDVDPADVDALFGDLDR